MTEIIDTGERPPALPPEDLERLTNAGLLRAAGIVADEIALQERLKRERQPGSDLPAAERIATSLEHIEIALTSIAGSFQQMVQGPGPFASDGASSG